MMLKLDDNNQSWYWSANGNNDNNKETYINHVYWSWHPSDPNVRNSFDRGDLPQTWDHSPVVPILAVVMLALTVFLLVLFRQNPGLVAGTVAGCLIVIGMYLTLNSVQENKLKFE